VLGNFWGRRERRRRRRRRRKAYRYQTRSSPMTSVAPIERQHDDAANDSNDVSTSQTPYGAP